MIEQTYYNNEVKQKYLAESTNATLLKSSSDLFAMTKEWEVQKQKELSEWERSELIDFLNRATGIAVYLFQRTVISPLSRYLQWTNNDFMPIHASELNFTEAYRSETLSSPRHLAQVLDQILDPVSHATFNVLRRCVMWLWYMGISVEDILVIDESWVDISQGKIEIRDIVYPIPQEALPAFKALLQLECFYIYRSPKPGGSPVVQRRKPGTLLVRDCLTSKAKPQKIAGIAAVQIYTEAQKKGVYWPGLIALRRSGVFYRLYQLEKAGIAPNFRLATTEIRGVPPSKARADYIKAVSNYTKIEYETWKNAFYPET